MYSYFPLAPPNNTNQLPRSAKKRRATLGAEGRTEITTVYGARSTRYYVYCVSIPSQTRARLVLFILLGDHVHTQYVLSLSSSWALFLTVSMNAPARCNTRGGGFLPGLGKHAYYVFASAAGAPAVRA